MPKLTTEAKLKIAIKALRDVKHRLSTARQSGPTSEILQYVSIAQGEVSQALYDIGDDLNPPISDEKILELILELTKKSQFTYIKGVLVQRISAGETLYNVGARKDLNLSAALEAVRAWIEA